MKYLQDIRAGQSDPQLLESLYQTARRENAVNEFTADLLACHEESPGNVLYAAWYYRLQQTPQVDQVAGRSVNWRLAIPLSVITGLIFAILSNSRFDLPHYMPYLMLFWAPIATCFVVAFLTITGNLSWKQAATAVIGLLGAGIYVTLFITQANREPYQTLMLFHLPLLAWIGTGLSVLGLRSDPQNRFAFLIKSIEVFITGGIYLIAGGVFAGITFGMFGALGIQIPDQTVRLFLAGGGGLIPVLAVATVYDPRFSPIEQRFEQGLGKVIFTLMRLLLPLALLVLIVYLLVIPFNFMKPFWHREVLIVYNAMLFAVMGLLIGATPVCADDLSPKQQSALRIGILAVATLTVLVSVYALSAIVYRTVQDGITVNRLTVIGWNGINVGLLVLLIYKQFKAGPAAWVRALQSAFSIGAVGYIVWAVFLTVAIPLLFR